MGGPGKPILLKRRKQNMPNKKLTKKLTLNKTTIARLEIPQKSMINGGAVLVTIVDCTQALYKCPANWSIQGLNTCIYTDAQMVGCPATMTLCGLLQCP